MKLDIQFKEAQENRLAYTVQEVAEMLAVTPKTIYRLVDRGLLKASKALRHLRITRLSVEMFLADTTEAFEIKR